MEIYVGMAVFLAIMCAIGQHALYSDIRAAQYQQQQTRAWLTARGYERIFTMTEGAAGNVKCR